jgi:hypothetical protein
MREVMSAEDEGAERTPWADTRWVDMQWPVTPAVGILDVGLLADAALDPATAAMDPATAVVTDVTGIMEATDILMGTMDAVITPGLPLSAA